MPDTGYTKTPLWKKLGLSEKRSNELLLIGAPAAFDVPDLPIGITVKREDATQKITKSIDFAIVFFRTESALARDIGRLAKRAYPQATLWIAWLRRQGGHMSDISDNVVRTHALPTGLVDIKVAALSEDWSGLRFAWRKDLR